MGSHSLLQGIFLPRDRTQISHIADRFFTSWATKEAHDSFIPSFLGNLHTVFHSGCINLHSSCYCTNSTRGFRFLHILSSICLLIFWWWLSDWCEVIGFTSFDVHLIHEKTLNIHCLLAICMSSLFRSFAHFLIGLFFWYCDAWAALCLLEINPLSVIWLAIIFSHSEGCLFTLFIVSFGCAKAEFN